MNPSDLYRTLQVDPEAEFEVIRAAYRVLAAKHHPDVGGSAETMARINSAWTTLSDRAARAAYDHQRHLRDGAARWDAYGKAARPTSADAGTILEFGRYAGWAIPDVAWTDPDYLEWLVRTPNGRRYQLEIDLALGHGPATAPQVDPMVRANKRGRHH
ncbi:MAG TPA: DnaJ domain-containing protein [Candidatus Limnocylindrales bacterium]|nr:DnaJ domain-containing protein [Candidatus Limnocylindrales bacterium]